MKELTKQEQERFHKSCKDLGAMFTTFAKGAAMMASAFEQASRALQALKQEHADKPDENAN